MVDRLRMSDGQRHQFVIGLVWDRKLMRHVYVCPSYDFGKAPPIEHSILFHIFMYDYTVHYVRNVLCEIHERPVIIGRVLSTSSYVHYHSIRMIRSGQLGSMKTDF